MSGTFQAPKATAHWLLAAPRSQEGNTALSSLSEPGDHLAPGSGGRPGPSGIAKGLDPT